MAVLERIDYKTIFTYFEEISGVPRGSRYNEKISNYLVEFAKKRIGKCDYHKGSGSWL